MFFAFRLQEDLWMGSRGYNKVSSNHGREFQTCILSMVKQKYNVTRDRCHTRAGLSELGFH